ncbi:GNAT family N-acetyltransferase [Chromatiales bacterium (ex Bugula neritina AB1)]|nr:GNAT family N-acetyltransferase [Chromatiales bacterium (ex Bugula neritina AB1)]
MLTRRLGPSDTHQYRAIMLRAYEQHPDAFTSSVVERAAKPPDWWQSRLSPSPTANQVVFGTLTDSLLVGVAGISFETREKVCHKATIFGMYVDPQVRGTGTGSMLLNKLLEQAQSRSSIRVVQLTVTEGNESAEKLYVKAGFRKFGVEPLAVRVQDGYVSKIHMWCDLEAMRL